MTNIYYQEQVLENIARKVLCGYDSALYYGSPAAVPIEEMIEAHGVSLEYQYLRKNGRILGKTIFDEGLEAVYDMENREYTSVCHRGRILDAASQTEPTHLRLFGPRQSAKAEWFTKCPKCGAQIGMIFQREVNIEQQQAGA